MSCAVDDGFGAKNYKFDLKSRNDFHANRNLLSQVNTSFGERQRARRQGKGLRSERDARDVKLRASWPEGRRGWCAERKMRYKNKRPIDVSRRINIHISYIIISTRIWQTRQTFIPCKPIDDVVFAPRITAIFLMIYSRDRGSSISFFFFFDELPARCLSPSHPRTPSSCCCAQPQSLRRSAADVEK